MIVAFSGSPRALVHAFLMTAVVVLMLCAGSAAAETMYVNGDAPINGDGTEANPFNTLPAVGAALVASSHADITVYFAGTFRGERLILETPYTNCQYLQWPGKPQAVVRGDVIIEGTWTQEVPGLRYSMPLNVGEEGIPSVVEDWDVRIDSQGRHYGHMTSAGSIAAVEQTEGSWFHDGTLLHIHASNDENPNTSGRVYARCVSKKAWYLGKHTNCVVDGIHFLLWVDPTPGEGYGIFMASAKNCTIRNCVAIDYGFHGFGFVGPSCTGNTFDGCVTRGGRDNGSTGFVFHRETGQLHSCRALDCEAHLHHLLDVLGQPLWWSLGSVGGFYAHTGSGGLITDLEIQRCKAYGYETESSFGFGASYNVATPSDPDDPESYAIRIYDSCLTDGVQNSIGQGAHLAFVRCDLDLTRMAEILPSSFAGFNTQGNSRVLFESCVIALNTDGLSGGSGFRIAANVQYLLRGCTVYDDGVQSTIQRNFFRFVASTSIVDASQTVFVHRTPQRLSIANGGVLVPAANQRFDHCWYDGIDPVNGYSSNPAFDSLAEFAAGIDPKGHFDVDPQFVDAPDDLEGTKMGPLLTTVELLPGVDRLGINQLEYSGHYGAHQYGLPFGCSADLDADGGVDALDLALLLGSWGPVQRGSRGDFDDSGVIGGPDLAVLLGAWGQCR